MSAPSATPAEIAARAVEDDASAARVVFRATGSGADGVRVNREPVRTDATPEPGGSLNPVEFALAALVSSQIATYRYRADELGIPLDDVDVEVEGELDVRGFFGIADGILLGLDEVRITVAPQGPASPDEYVRLLAEVDARCPVLDLSRAPPTVRTELVLDT